MVKKIILTLLVLTFPLFGFAQSELIVEPVVIDQTLKIRDEIDFSVVLENKGTSSIRFYPVLAEVSKLEGVSFNEETDKSKNLVEWLEIERRRIEIKPGETEKLDLTADISAEAQAGTYYGKVVFAEGSTREKARENAQLASYPEIFLRIKVIEGIVENAQLKNFTTDKDISLTDSVQFLTDIHNIGNRAIKPNGSIFVYKERNNKEVAVLDINEEGKEIESQGKYNLEKVWDEAGFGKYKAILRAEYGEKTTRDLQSTTYFWVIPWPFVAGFLILIFSLIAVLIILLKRLAERAGYLSNQ